MRSKRQHSPDKISDSPSIRICPADQTDDESKPPSELTIKHKMDIIKKPVKIFSKDKGKKGASSVDSGVGKTFFHGTLILDIKEARNLPDMESVIAKMVDKKDVTDAYVDVLLGKCPVAKTRIINNDLNPVWNEDYRIECCHWADELIFKVADKDHAYAEFIGSVVIPTATLFAHEIKDEWMPIKKKSGSHKGDIRLSIKFIPTERLKKSYRVRHTYFPMHKKCNVTLYQDAHCPQHKMPQFNSLIGPDGRKHEMASCWKDVHSALINARHIICITGWAVWTKVKLFRGEDMHIDSRTLGELLLNKAEEGVKVYVMIWSDRSSGDFKKTGVMGTYDMETVDFFKGTLVNCALVPRDMSKHELTDHLQNQLSTSAYSHHQKTIICDAEAPPGHKRRPIVAFVGGLDLTGGRWDTPNHELFSTLLNEHSEDFYNNNTPTVEKTQGPRQPWHDIHSRVEGPAAYDVFVNFYERWRKQGRKFGKLKPLDEKVIDISMAASNVQPGKEWNVQLFRSITSDSADFDEQIAEELNCKKGRTVEASICQAYVQAIRNAENYLYIENQYFLGSAFAWTTDRDINCHHTVPVEIAAKICAKIMAKADHFVAYVVIPMFPEGNPASAPIQEILYWQTRTMEMMYRKIGDAIKMAGSKTHPTDWLVFLCPAKREIPGAHLDRLQDPAGSVAKDLRETLRFPIYVHSKMLIVDDAYIIVGSANINMRSMAGTRDTEIAVGCWQPHFVGRNALGDVHMFRSSLWNEHLRITDPAFRYPGTVACVKKLKELVQYNWSRYIGPVGTDMPGQLLPYPLDVTQNGDLHYLEGIKEFPGFPNGSKIMGKKSTFLPQKVTT